MVDDDPFERVNSINLFFNRLGVFIGEHDINSHHTGIFASPASIGGLFNAGVEGISAYDSEVANTGMDISNEPNRPPPEYTLALMAGPKPSDDFIERCLGR